MTKVTDTPAYRAIYSGFNRPGRHFPALAFAKLVAAGGVLKSAQLTSGEHNRLLRLANEGLLRTDGRLYEVTVDGWLAVSEATEKMVLDGAEGLL